MTLARQVLEDIARELQPNYPRVLKVKRTPGYQDGTDGSLGYSDVIVQKQTPDSGFLRSLIAKSDPLLIFRTTWDPNSGYQYDVLAFDRLAFETAKARYAKLTQTIDDKSARNKFKIVFGTLNERVREALREVIAKLPPSQKYKIKVQTEYERDRHGLTVAPFANTYKIIASRKGEVASISVLSYNPGNGSDGECLLYKTSDERLSDLLEKTLRKTAIDHAENGFYPRSDRIVEVKRGSAKTAVLFFGIERSEKFVELK